MSSTCDGARLVVLGANPCSVAEDVPVLRVLVEEDSRVLRPPGTPNQQTSLGVLHELVC